MVRKSPLSSLTPSTNPGLSPFGGKVIGLPPKPSLFSPLSLKHVARLLAPRQASDLEVRTGYRS